MNNIYVETMPKDCSECPMCRSGNLKLQRNGRYVEAQQCVFGKYKYQTIDDEIDTCPLKLISEHDKEKDLEILLLKERIESLNSMGADFPKLMLGVRTEERKKVVQEIRQKVEKNLVRMQEEGVYGISLAIGWYEISRVLDQIERGE